MTALQIAPTQSEVAIQNKVNLDVIREELAAIQQKITEAFQEIAAKLHLHKDDPQMAEVNAKLAAAGEEAHQIKNQLMQKFAETNPDAYAKFQELLHKLEELKARFPTTEEISQKFAESKLGQFAHDTAQRLRASGAMTATGEQNMLAGLQ